VTIANKTDTRIHRMCRVFGNVELQKRHVHRIRVYTLFTSLTCHWLWWTTL